MSANPSDSHPVGSAPVGTASASSLLQDHMSDIFLLCLVAAIVFGYFYQKRMMERKKDRSPPSSKAAPVVTTPVPTCTKNLMSKMRESNKNVAIFFGSQTGTAEDYANRIAREAKQYGFEPAVIDIETYDLTDLAEFTKDMLVFFVVATYGEGEPTDNAQDAYTTFSEDDLEPGLMSNLNFVVFGLGNKTYEQYNVMGQFWDRRLEELGGHRVFTLGLGDDDGNLEEDFISWKDEMWPAVCSHFGKDALAASGALVREFRVVEKTEEEVPLSRLFSGEIGPRLVPPAQQTRPPYDIKNPFYADVVVHRELMPTGHNRRAMHIEVNLKGISALPYSTGDHIGVFAPNSALEVERLAAALGIANLDTIISIVPADPSSPKQSPFPCPTTYRTAFTHYLDIVTPPRTHIIQALVQSAPEGSPSRGHLQALLSPESKEELNRYLNVDYRSLADILLQYPDIRPPVDLILELLPRLQCRYYSIATSSRVSPDTVAICASLTEFTTNTGRQVTGVATGMFANIKPAFEAAVAAGDPASVAFPTMPVFIRSSSFKLPALSTRPVLMIGPGTGVAPFRGFVQERLYQRDNLNREVGDTVLFFGARFPEEFLYEEEFRAAEESGLLELHVCFSRVPGTQHKYVQHLLEVHRERVWDLIQRNALIYVCGDAKNMARDVNRKFVDIARDLGGLTEEDAVNFVKKLRSDARYFEDVWT